MFFRLTAAALVSVGVTIVALGEHTCENDAVDDDADYVGLLSKVKRPRSVEGVSEPMLSFADGLDKELSYAQEIGIRARQEAGEDDIKYSANCTVVRSEGDEIIDSMRLANNVGDNLKLACAVYTYSGNRRQTAETYHTWGKSCDSFLAYSDESWLIPNSLGVWTIPLRQGLAQYEDIWQSVQMIWTDLADRLADRTLDFSYVTFSGDDALFILPNLHAYLAELPPLTTDNALQTTGHEFQPTGFEIIGGVDDAVLSSGFPWVGGAGYVLNREVIAARLLSKCDPEVRQSRSATEDVLTSQCLFAAGVFPRDTRDEEGKPRFCRSRPGLSCYARPDAGPSKDAVLFHYLEGQRRQAVVDRLYGCRSGDGQLRGTA